MKTKIFNLIILDESGSMACVERQTISGCNETIDTIVNAQRKYGETQEHFISIYAFQEGGRHESRFLIKNLPADKIRKIDDKDYVPGGCTPLYDAMGATLTDLKRKLENEKFAVGSVTIITDGYENSSVQYSLNQIVKMISQLKEMGWNFNFIGANIDVQKTAEDLKIDNYLAFEQTEEGTKGLFDDVSSAQVRYCKRIAESEFSCVSPESFRVRMRKASNRFFEDEDESGKDKK